MTEKINKVIGKVKLSASLLLHGFFHGLKAADSEISGSKIGSDSTDNGVHKQVEKGGVLMDMLQGKVTEEVKQFRWEKYQVDDEVQNFKYIGNGLAVKKNMASETYPKVEETVGYQVKIIQDNEIIPPSLVEEQAGFDKGRFAQEYYRVEIGYDFPPRFNLEKYVKRLVVKKNEKEDIILDLYIPKIEGKLCTNPKDSKFNVEMKKIYETKCMSDIISPSVVQMITEKAFGCHNMYYFKYENLRYLTTTLFDGSYIMHFAATATVDGEYLHKKYYNEKKDKALANNSARTKQPTFTVTQEILDNLAKK